MKVKECFKKIFNQEILFCWLGSMVGLLALSLMFSYFSDFFLKSFDIGTSWLSVMALFICGIYAAISSWDKSKIISLLITFSFSTLATSYLAYVVFNYGATHPNIAAIGFNIPTISLAIVFALYVKKNR